MQIVKTILGAVDSYTPPECNLVLDIKKGGLRVVDKESTGTGKQYPPVGDTGKKTSEVFKQVVGLLRLTGVNFGNTEFDFNRHLAVLDGGLVLFLEMFGGHHWRVRVRLPNGRETVIETVSNGLCYFGALSTILLIAGGFYHWESFTLVKSPPANTYEVFLLDGNPTGITFSGAYSDQVPSNPYIDAGFQLVPELTVVGVNAPAVAGGGAAPASSVDEPGESDEEMARRLQEEEDANYARTFC